MIFDSFDVVVVPFPFSDRTSLKRRPALVLSSRAGFNALSGQLVLAMIASTGNAPLPLDVPITDRRAAGLRADAVVRMKLFTLDRRMIVRKTGRLAAADAAAVRAAVGTLLGA